MVFIICYRVFFLGIKNGFEHQNAKSYWISELRKAPDVSISFNVAGIKIWEDILKSGVHHIMWTVDSCFYQNFHIVNEYINFPNFHVCGLAKTDIEPLNYFYPEFKNYHYLPLGADPNIWKYEKQEKDLDIVYLSSVQDPQEILKAVQAKLPANLFDPFMDMYNYLIINPDETIWDLFKELFIAETNNIDKKQHALLFHYFFQNLTYLISYTKRIELIKSMEDVGVKIWGNDEWKKYVSGKNEYMGVANFEDAIKILPRSKISLNLQPIQIYNELHDRILNSVMSESCVLCDSTPEIKNAFGDNLMYYDVKNFTNIKQKALSLLKNKDLREYKTQKAKEIILNDHTWESRAKSIIEIMRNIQKQTHAPLV